MPESLETRLKNRAHELGFSLVGIAPATEADGFARFTRWLDAGYAGEMQYLPKRREARQHPRSIVPEVRSVVMMGLEYGGREAAEAGDSSASASESWSGRVARYAQAPDYHRWIWDRLNELADWLRAEVPDTIAFGVSDTAPLLERDFARRAGLGWFGRNTLLINKRRGSYFLLGALLTNLDLVADPPHESSHCGSCTACLNACPTQAFPEAGTLDARRCISYLTIELRGPMPEELREAVGDRIFGCDICQEVCPWNRHPGASESLYPHDPTLAALDPVELLSLSDAEFRRRFRGTSFFRSKRSGLLRNAAIVLGNVGDARAIPALEQAATDADEVIAEAARWAIQQIRHRFGSSPPK